MSGSNGSGPVIETALAAAAGAVQQELDRILPKPDGPAARLAEAMRYAVLGGGKRMRAYLVMETARMTNADPAQASRVAAAVECIHAYSLIHDDLPAMDNDDERHGKPTVHRAYDEATAILAGDALQSVAFEIIANPPTSDDAVRRSDIVLILSRAVGVGGMAGGQMEDLLAERRGEGGAEPMTLDDVRLMQSMKTGALIRASVLCGARLGQTTREGAAALDYFGDRLGAVFQIRDDLLDVEGDPAETGKKLRKDDAAGKATFVSLLGVDGAKSHAAKLLDEAMESLNSFGPSADGLRDAANFALTRSR